MGGLPNTVCPKRLVGFWKLRERKKSPACLARGAKTQVPSFLGRVSEYFHTITVAGTESFPHFFDVELRAVFYSQFHLSRFAVRFDAVWLYPR